MQGRAYVRTVWAPKAGPEDYEDSFRRDVPGAAADGGALFSERVCFRTSIADGAGAGYLAADWAGKLTELFGSTQVTSVGPTADMARALWPAVVADFEERRRAEGRPVGWNDRRKLDAGEGAAFLSLLATPANSEEGRTGRWLAEAVGDVCLFRVAQSQLLDVFPLACSSDFDRRPALIRSDADAREDSQRVGGYWETEAEFFLATDEMAKWILREVEEARPPWELLRTVVAGGCEAFSQWIETLRELAAIDLDDMTLQHVCLHEDWSRP